MLTRQYKKSFYLEITEPLKISKDLSGRLVYATRTGSLLLINNEVYPSFERNEFQSLPDDLKSLLIESQAIVPIEENELTKVLTENVEAIKENDTLNIVIQPGASCQLGCHYCGQQHTKKYMDENLRRNLVERIRLKISESNCSKMTVTWYGAEPLMAINHIYSISEEIIAICDERDIEYHSGMVTNGLSLKKEVFKKLSEDCKVSTFQITIDGVAEYHDLNRYLKKANGPTFDIIFNNILSIVNDPSFSSEHTNIVIRCNVDQNNVAGLDEFIDLLDESKLQDKISFYLIPIHNWGDNEVEIQKGVKKDDFSILEIDWIMTLMNRGFSANILPGRTKVVCSTVKDHSEVYDAYGNISTCWEVPYTPIFSHENSDYELGNLNNPMTVNNRSKVPLQNWNNDIAAGESKSPCGKCNLLPVCGGSCPIHWLSDTVACPSFKYNIQDRMVLEFLNRRQISC